MKKNKITTRHKGSGGKITISLKHVFHEKHEGNRDDL